MNTILAPLCELEDFIRCKEEIKKGGSPVAVIGCVDTQKSHFISGLSDVSDIQIIVTCDEVRAGELVSDLSMYDRDVIYYPAKDLIFFSADVHGQAITAQRLSVIKKLVAGEPVTIVTTIDGGMDAQIPFSYYMGNGVTISTGDTIDMDEFIKKLADMGYERTDQVDTEGEFSVRGGILDVYPLTEESPCRIDFFDDEIDQIRSIDVESQRSVEILDSVRIDPAAEVFMDEDGMERGLHTIMQEMESVTARMKEDGHKEAAARLRQNVESFKDSLYAYHGMVNLESYIRYFIPDEPVSFFDYFKGMDVTFFIDEPGRVIEKAEVIEAEFRESMSMRLEKGYILPSQADIMFSPVSVYARLKSYPLVLMQTLDGSVRDFEVKKKFLMHVQAAPSYSNNFSMLAKDIIRYKKQGYRVLLVSASETRGRRLCDDLTDFDINAFYDGDMTRGLQSGEVMITRGNLRKGFEYPKLRFVVVTEGDIFGKRHKKKKRKRYEGKVIHSFNDLKLGDYVVHENHGLGIYEGIEKIEIDHIIKDYLKISYAGKDNLYVPATSLEVLQKYAGADAKPPKLNKLNSSEWKKTKSRVLKAVEDIAGELIELYAKRQARQGHAFDKDTVWQKEFEELFPYEETPDQLHAIEDTKKDMESVKIMDRLICGDVGYGKTEVAIRAAFKAVMDGMQVAVLVPTTILASQHYQTFTQRMKDFGVVVELLCRLRTPSEQRRTIQGLAKGRVDIVIGTHRLLSKTIEYKKLGLLIIDEEQRFGVKHKEKLKQIKNDIDVLTLTATPIPRTLHMSLIGIRDMSVLEEPPLDRMPIQTFVMEKSDEIVREAILREINRSGQVYYVYNRVNNMDIVVGGLRKLIPEAQIAYAHGQMNERQLEDTMLDFIEGEIDVLVATTIVESGLDIPNVNTIIIEDADRLGLSQLYQLRGRVGRSGRNAYAFLMYKRDKMLKEVAEKRLAAIREFTELGSGLRISMRDLEIRGAGNLLGASQHGHMAAVGYDLYCKMLDEAITRLRGDEKMEPYKDTSVDIKIDAYIPTDYISNELQKLDIYKRIAEIETDDEKKDMKEELTDRFGRPPKSVENLLSIALLKARAHSAYITEISDKGDHMRFTMDPDARIDPSGIPGMIKEYAGMLRFVPVTDGAPYFIYRYDGAASVAATEMVGEIYKLRMEDTHAGER